jgi:hypothetical protein
MPRTRSARSRRSRRAPGRVVKVSRLIQRADNRLVATLESYDWGLEAARLLQFFWPDWFAEHVAGRAVTLPGLMQVGSAFLSLAEARLFHLHDCGLDSFWITPEDPVEALEHDFSVNWPADLMLASLGEELQTFLAYPMPNFYGLGRDVYQFGNDRLLNLFWWLCADTTWETYEIRDLLSMLRGDSFYERLTAIPHLHARTPMMQLSEALDALPEGERFGVELGTLLAYASRQTGNEFADFSHDEMDGWQPLDWRNTNTDWATIRENQDIAIGWSRQYYSIAERIAVEPELVTVIGQTIVRTAEKVTGGLLINILDNAQPRVRVRNRGFIDTNFVGVDDDDNGTGPEITTDDGAGDPGGEEAGDRATLEFAQAPARTAVAA